MMIAILIGAALAAAGYGFRGIVHGKLIAAGKEMKSLESRLSLALLKDVASLREDVFGIIADIKKVL